jgi:hypothetical protein
MVEARGEALADKHGDWLYREICKHEPKAD